MRIFTFDTTLRDGTQGEAVSFSVDDKLVIAQKLDELGIDYIEGGWPGSNPKDKEFFSRARELDLKHAGSPPSAPPASRAIRSTRTAMFKPWLKPALPSSLSSEKPGTST
jgi:isopropylmalate/homocitrate/citramalate synthase